jgi:hypothetical protein
MRADSIARLAHVLRMPVDLVRSAVEATARAAGGAS